MLSAILYLPITYLLFPKPIVTATSTYTWGGIYLASLVGVILTGAIVLITNYYTSTSFSPVRKIALASETGHAHQHHRGACHRSAGDGVAGHLHRARDPAELLRR